MITAHERLLIIDNLNFAMTFVVCSRSGVGGSISLATGLILCQLSFCEDLKTARLYLRPLKAKLTTL